jgi:hypothetical protein
VMNIQLSGESEIIIFSFDCSLSNDALIIRLLHFYSSLQIA